MGGSILCGCTLGQLQLQTTLERGVLFKYGFQAFGLVSHFGEITLIGNEQLVTGIQSKHIGLTN
jgi:hypothetical protein